MEYGHIGSFRNNPGKVWKMLMEMDELLSRALPNSAHFALAQLEDRRILKRIITQNIDSLHQRAGSSNVIEFHGSNRSLRCDVCGERFARESVSLATLPPSCSCGSALRPDFVFFGETISPEAYGQAISAAEECDFMLIVGTSASVAPASHLPRIAKSGGAYLLEINPSSTDLSLGMSDFHIARSAGMALPAIVAALGNKNLPYEEMQE
jgi:NAD-dependent deacetylase